jgi:hypothetical protein
VLFVAPCLYRSEKRAFLPFLAATPVLFISARARLRLLERVPDGAVADRKLSGPHSVTQGWYFNDGNWLSAIDALALADANRCMRVERTPAGTA